MNITDLKTAKDYTFKNIVCNKKIENKIIIAKEGRIKLVGNNHYVFISDRDSIDFSIDDESCSKTISDFIERHFYNLAYIRMEGDSNNNFFIDLSFFYSMDRLGDIDIIFEKKAIESLQKKKFINNANDLNREIENNFILSDGIDSYFAYTVGSYYKSQYEEYEFEEEADLEENKDITEEYEKENTNELNIDIKSKVKNERYMIIYGKNYSIQISIEGEDDEEQLVCKKIIYMNQNNIPKMSLAKGSLKFKDKTNFITSKVKQILSESPGYLDLWDKYAELEGEFLLQKVRKVGQIFIDRKNINMEGDSIVVYLKESSQDAVNLLSNGDYLLFSHELPEYIVDEDLTWNEYKLTSKSRPIETSKSKEFEEEDEQKNKKKTQKDSLVRIIEVDKRGFLKLEDANISPEYITLSILGDKMQIERRETARRMILDGESANPSLGLIIDGKMQDGLANEVKSKKENSLSPFVKNKIFKNEPTKVQLDAISMALNTPDIAIIQGPPGTGKTTVITAIIERLNELADKKSVNKGQVLVTSFQHDAVRNVIERLSINSLPTIKFGTKIDDDLSKDEVIENWCCDLIDNLKEKNQLLKDNYYEKELFRLYNFYNLYPNDENALAFLEFAKKNNFDENINTEIELLMEELGIHNDEDNTNLVNIVRKIRTTRDGFEDDGADNAFIVYDKINKIINKKNEENKFILDTLLDASDCYDDVPDELLQDLDKVKGLLLEKCIPRPFYKIQKPREEIINIYARIKNNNKKPENELEEILFNLLDELTNNPISVKRAIEEYNFVYASTTQQSEGKDIRMAKNVKKGEHPVYDTVIVDEAARVNPGDLMIPLAQAARRIILVGDHRQLPHIYDEEIFESLQEKGNIENQDDVKITLFQYLMNNSKKLTQKDNIPRTITLDSQYRMHPLLGNFVSENFYEPYGEGFKSPLGPEFFKQPLYTKPLVWIDMKHDCGKSIKRGTSRVRECEADYIVRRIKHFMSMANGRDLSYGVITFYSAQVKEIKNKLGDLADKVRVGSVDAFQGMEFDVIFLSVVRTESQAPKNIRYELLEGEFLEDSEEKKEQNKYIEKIGQSIYGFLTSENRLCVSLSRQKKLLIVVGNSDIFVKDSFGKIAEKCVPAMKNLYNLCVEEGVIEKCLI